MFNYMDDPYFCPGFYGLLMRTIRPGFTASVKHFITFLADKLTSFSLEGVRKGIIYRNNVSCAQVINYPD